MLGQWLVLHGGAVPNKMSDAQRSDWAFILRTTTREQHQELYKNVRTKNFYTGHFAVTRLVGWEPDGGGSVIEPTLTDYLEFDNLAFSPWGFGPVRWVLKDTLMLPERIQCRGAQGLWEIDPFHEGRILNFLAEKGVA
jgi:hypothetical protein